MTDPHGTTRPEGGEDSRAPRLLGRAGEVESAPAPSVWDRIRAELDEEAPGRDHASAGPSPTSTPGATPPPSRVGSSRRAWPLLAAAAVGALLTWAGAALLGDDGTGSGTGELVASGTLQPLPEAGTGSQGEAEVVTVDGHQRLRVELDTVPDADGGYLEVWLLRPDVSGMVTLGVLTDEVGEFDLPAGVDLGDYPVVDISRERVDGDPTHGGDSLVRGQLEGASAGHLPGDDLE
jgi:hypothetical protein